MSEQKPPQDPFEMFRRLWGPLGVPLPGMAMPTLDPRELDKRIADLRSIEAWLNMNLNMVKFSIQGWNCSAPHCRLCGRSPNPRKTPTAKENEMPKAVRFHKQGGPEVLQYEDIPVGDPGPGQARVRQTAIGVNFVDTYQRSGLYPAQLPQVAGNEGAGVVEAVGPNVTDVKKGDRVAYTGLAGLLLRERASCRPIVW